MRSLLNYRNYGRLWRVYGRSVVRYTTARKVLNALKTEWAYRRRIADVRSYPYILFLEPLYYCNLDCPFCDRQVFPDARKGREAAGKLSLDLFDRILDEMGDYLFQCQIFGQGEPMLDWARTRAIIEKCHRRRIFTLLSTNCTLITPKSADELVTCGLDHLVCAIDGISQESYAKYRVGGNVEQALAGMRHVVEARRRHRSGTEIEWQFLVYKDNLHELPRARKLAADLGVFLRTSPMRGMEFDDDLQREWLPDASSTDGAPYQAGRITDGQTIYPWPCYFLWRSLVLNSNARVARCLVYQNVAEYGSLNDSSVHALYNHPSAQRARQLFSRKPVPDGPFPSPCNNCSWYERHHGGPNLGKHASLRAAAAEADSAFSASFVPVTVNRSNRHNAQLPPVESVGTH
jgi:MoaA/NifB/PqqE/SkfB family radical SAM enzyme